MTFLLLISLIAQSQLTVGCGLDGPEIFADCTQLVAVDLSTSSPAAEETCTGCGGPRTATGCCAHGVPLTGTITAFAPTSVAGTPISASLTHVAQDIPSDPALAENDGRMTFYRAQARLNSPHEAARAVDMMSRRNFGEVVAGVALSSVASVTSGQTLHLPRTVAGVRVPDSELAKSAAQLAWAASPEYLYNHCMRTFVFASLIYAKASTKYDEEIVFIASILHDLGLVPEFMSPDDRFDIDGANAAEKFLREHNVARERSDMVWEAIALHAGGGAVARRRGPEVAAVGLGAAIDIQGFRIADFSVDELRQILDAYPRLGVKKKFVQSIVEMCRRKPAAQIGHFTAEIGRAHIRDFACPTIEASIMAAPYAD